MAKDANKLAVRFESENTGGLWSGFLAEEDVVDRRTLWRLGSWGAASVAAVVLAVYANQSTIALHREQIAAADLARQAQQIQSAARESQNETRRLASAIDTLNGDRDRLYSRVTVLEQGLDSVTGAIAKQNVAATSPQAAPASAATATGPQSAAQNPTPAPVASPVATTAAKSADKPAADAAAPAPVPVTVASVTQKTSNTPATTNTAEATPAPPLVAAKSMMAPPDAAAGKLIEPEKPAKAVVAAPMPEVVASTLPAEDTEADASQAAAPKLAVERTEFGVDVGGANSLGGLRALWRGLLKSRSNAALTTLRPIIVIKEASNGLGMQLRLVAGPLGDAAAAAKICAGLIENERPCETAVFDGQRLAMNVDEAVATAKPAVAKPAPARPYARRRAAPKREAVEEPPKKPDSPSTLSSFFGKR